MKCKDTDVQHVYMCSVCGHKEQGNVRAVGQHPVGLYQREPPHVFFFSPRNWSGCRSLLAHTNFSFLSFNISLKTKAINRKQPIRYQMDNYELPTRRQMRPTETEDAAVKVRAKVHMLVNRWRVDKGRKSVWTLKDTGNTKRCKVWYRSRSQGC